MTIPVPQPQPRPAPEIPVLPLILQSLADDKALEPVVIDLAGNPILVADHCYGCTAGQGSSCGGALK